MALETRVIDEKTGREVAIYNDDMFKIGDYFNRKTGGLIEAEAELRKTFMFNQNFLKGRVALALSADKTKGLGFDGSGNPIFYFGGGATCPFSGLWGSHNFNPNNYLPKSGGSINGSLDVSGELIVRGRLKALGGIEVSGWTITVE